MVWLASLLTLAGCASTPPPVAQQPPEPPAPTRDLLAEVRLAAADAGDVIEVQPLRDPGVDDLLLRAERGTERGRLKSADRALSKALELVPNDPEIMQRRAEVLLARRQLDEAEQLAYQSFERGPQLGSLCRRNWATVQFAREERGDQEGAARALDQRLRCVVEPPVRM
ncbi:tetratricopeptide repeat protein [Pseudomarimonas arenosa]|uniref:Tetratricopeptide repeat protein n=1 Tax=Pseudomarimonas arenosa TaxID=2774145 RepID=A0AAW3ZPP7_9GAMM|nr:tetratricopeptide repeat protein [Pseudomarimonas arenosa]MBD8527127.1 tetratricopeptide repeat protein [Pseudomarimonas arenosa]